MCDTFLDRYKFFLYPSISSKKIRSNNLETACLDNIEQND